MYRTLVPRSTRARIFVALVLIVLIGAGLFYMRYRPREGSVSFHSAYDLVLKDYAGADVGLSEFKREILVIHSWATWCTYCAEELKNLATLKATYGEQIEILAPNRAESVQVAKPFTDQLGVGESMRFLIDPDDAFYRSIGGYAMPETLFINDRGEIFHHQRGPMNRSEVEDKISALLK